MKISFIVSIILSICFFGAAQNSINLNNSAKTHDSLLVGYLSSNPKQDELFCKQAEQLMQQKKYTEAFANFSKAIALNPIAKYYCKRGACLMLQNKYNEALTNFDNAISNDTNYSEAYFLKATVFQFTNKTNEAVNFYSKAITINPNFTEAYLMRGLLYATIKKNKQACDDLHKALNLGSNKAQLHINEVCGG
ncbi:MAG: hypothetical protein IPP32_12710 [Bacteroidetes bacterium]|nr:hypothetical protein [Bacteroidota bacterium]